MKTANLKVGVKGVPAITVPVRDPETLEDLQSLSHGSLEVLIRWARRGFRIECQERSGARDAVREAGAQGQADETAKAALTQRVAGIVGAFDPTVVTPRATGPRNPVELKVQKGKRYSQDELAALLAGAGIKANITTE